MLDESFPLISVRISPKGSRFISLRVKYLLKLRKKTNKLLPTGLEDKLSRLIRDNQQQAVKSESNRNAKGLCAWWATINSITGRTSKYQYISAIIDRNHFIINEYFCSINTDLEHVPLVPLVPIDIPEGTRVPELPLSLAISY